MPVPSASENMRLLLKSIALLLAIKASTCKAQSFLWTESNLDIERVLQGGDECPVTKEARELETTCPRPQTIDKTLGTREPWEPLTSAESEYVEDILYERLTLRYSDNPFLEDTIWGVILKEPNKAETLAYLDDNGPMPGRYARATVYHGSLGYIMEYDVGPIPFPNLNVPADETVTMEAIREPGEIPLQALPLDGARQSELQSLVDDFVDITEVDSFLNEAFGSTSTISWVTHEFGLTRNRTNAVPVSWYRSFSRVDNILSHPLPLECMVEFGSYTDPSTWRLHSIVYRHQFFPEVGDFIDALKSGSVNIVPTKPFDDNPFWQTLEKRQSSRPNNCDPPASNVEPGARYTVNGGRVSWLGWSFHITNRPRTATALHDISFMGDRIAYEVSLQELNAVYSGYVPSMANKFLFDSDFYVGWDNRNLVEGVDCPMGAYISGNTCIFEHDKGVPLWRKDGGTKWYAGAKNTHLVVRTIFEVGNYDYLVEFKFSLDGQIDVGFAASGQLFMSAYNKKEEPFGTRVHDEALANIHAHYAGFKVDLDILGANNCVEKEAIVYKARADIPETANQPAKLNVPEKSLAIERTILQNELEGRVRVKNRHPTQYKVVSCNETNQWGYLRGYEIHHPNTPLAIYDEAFPGYQAYHIVFAQHKESESFLSTHFDSMTRGEPYMPITGAKGISNNAESLVDEDIVAWVGLGFYHLPRVEDNPVTNVVSSHFSLRPFNYFDENPSIDLGQTIRTRYGDVQNSVPTGNCSVDL